MKNLMKLASCGNPAKFVWQEKPKDIDFYEIEAKEIKLDSISKVKRELEMQLYSLKNQKEKMLNTKEYKKAYEKIVSGDMDLPPEIWEKIKNKPKSSFLKNDWNQSLRIKTNNQTLDIIANSIINKDANDLKEWFLTENGKEFMNGNYKDLEHYILKKAGF